MVLIEVMETIRRKRYTYLDLIKIMSAFMVTFYHFAHGRIDYNYNELNAIYIPNLERCVMSCCAVSVPLFFMVNGALLLSKDRNIKEMLYKIVKIAILIVVWYATGFPSWFFKTLIILYFITPMLRCLYVSKRKILYAMLIALLIFPYLYNYAILFMKITDINININFGGHEVNTNELTRTGLFTMYSIVYYVFGIIIHQSKHIQKRGIYIVLLLCGFVALLMDVVLNTYIEHSMFDGVNASFPTLGAFSMSLGVYGLFKSFKYGDKAKRLLIMLSPYVLCIYVMHIFVITVVANKLLLINNISLFGAIAFCVLVDGICVAVGMIINKIPILKEVIKI